MSIVKFTDNSAEVLEALEGAVNTALTAIGMTAETHAKEETPVDTGRLRNSISHAVEEHSAYIGTNVEYAPYVELGSRNHKAHHMLQKAAADHTEEYKKIAEQALKGT